MAPQPTTYFHSVELQRNKCQGCVSCVKLCPTEAIRVRNGKAEIWATAVLTAVPVPQAVLTMPLA